DPMPDRKRLRRKSVARTTRRPGTARGTVSRSNSGEKRRKLPAKSRAERRKEEARPSGITRRAARFRQSDAPGTSLQVLQFLDAFEITQNDLEKPTDYPRFVELSSASLDTELPT